MYVIRKYDRNNKPQFKTYDGWARTSDDGTLDLSDVIRFTKGEASAMKLGRHEQFVWFGCYKEL